MRVLASSTKTHEALRLARHAGRRGNDAVRVEHDLVVVALELQVTVSARNKAVPKSLRVMHRFSSAIVMAAPMPCPMERYQSPSGWTPESSSITSPRPSSDHACHKACSFMCVPEASPRETKHRSSSTTASKTSNSVPFMGSGVRSTKVFHAKTVRDVPCPCSRKAASASGHGR